MAEIDPGVRQYLLSREPAGDTPQDIQQLTPVDRQGLSQAYFHKDAPEWARVAAQILPFIMPGIMSGAGSLQAAQQPGAQPQTGWGQILTYLPAFLGVGGQALGHLRGGGPEPSWHDYKRYIESRQIPGQGLLAGPDPSAATKSQIAQALTRFASHYGLDAEKILPPQESLATMHNHPANTLARFVDDPSSNATIGRFLQAHFGEDSIPEGLKQGYLQDKQPGNADYRYSFTPEGIARIYLSQQQGQ